MTTVADLINQAIARASASSKRRGPRKRGERPIPKKWPAGHMPALHELLPSLANTEVKVRRRDKKYRPKRR